MTSITVAEFAAFNTCVKVISLIKYLNKVILNTQ